MYLAHAGLVALRASAVHSLQPLALSSTPAAAPRAAVPQAVWSDPRGPANRAALGGWRDAWPVCLKCAAGIGTCSVVWFLGRLKLPMRPATTCQSAGQTASSPQPCGKPDFPSHTCFFCVPDSPPAHLLSRVQELQSLLGSPMLEGYLRPGCSHLTLDALLQVGWL